MRIIEKIKCLRLGHVYMYDGYTVGGCYIRCYWCGNLDEYIPGVHEPKGYVV